VGPALAGGHHGGGVQVAGGHGGVTQVPSDPAPASAPGRLRLMVVSVT
jgi:hypothetical protein